MRFLGALMIVLSGTGLGVYFAGNVKYRIKHLKELMVIMNTMSAEIRYASSSLSDIAFVLSKKKNVYSEFFRELSVRMENMEKVPFKELWKSGIDEHLKHTCLTEEDKIELKRLGENLGSLDTQMQVDTISMFSKDMEDKIKDLVITSNEKIKLCYALGMLGSIFIVVIMV